MNGTYSPLTCLDGEETQFGPGHESAVQVFEGAPVHLMITDALKRVSRVSNIASALSGNNESLETANLMHTLHGMLGEVAHILMAAHGVAKTIEGGEA